MILLQILDEGSISQGRKVDFKVFYKLLYYPILLVLIYARAEHYRLQITSAATSPLRHNTLITLYITIHTPHSILI